MTGNPDLIAEIRKEIGLHGPIPFARFMELALYHPHHGYYTSGRARIGKGGDYFTSPTVGPLFGRFLAMQFVEMWEIMGKPKPFTLLELGANRGWLKKDIVEWARERRPDFAEAMRYWTCERGAKDESDAFSNWDEIETGSVTGCIFSNELVDSLPVHLIRRGFASGRTYGFQNPSVPNPRDWQELYVNFFNGEWVIENSPFSFDPDLLPFTLREFPYPVGYTTEVHIVAIEWLNQMARILRQGFLLTIDYGFIEEKYYAPHRKDGTLLCYHQHEANRSPLERVGEQDITAHVNFGALVRQGIILGLDELGFTDQSRFLMGIGKEEIARIVNANPGKLDPMRQQLQTLLNPADMGRTFKVLIQQKGVSSAKLSGLQYGRINRG